MRSIRRHLLNWFLLGVALIWIGAGLAVYLSYRAGLMAGVEAEVQSLLRQVRMSWNIRSGAGPRFEGPGGGGRGHGGRNLMERNFAPDIYWQVWPLDGDGMSRSSNLASDLPRADLEPGESVIRIVTLEEGVKAMVASSLFGLGQGGGSPGHLGGGRGGGGRATEISVAKDLIGVDRAMNRVLLLIVLSGVLVGGVTVFGIRLLLHKGLTPLRLIGEEVSAIDTESLEGSFSEEGLPEELRPIVFRLNELMERVGNSFARERRFSSDLAHEVRTPLAELRIQAESALKWPDEGGSDAWGGVLESVARMERVVQAMLKLAQLDQKGDEQKQENLELGELIEESWTTHAALANQRRVTLRVELDQETKVVGDRSLWSLMLGNLVGNAVEYSDQNDEVLVSAESLKGEDLPVVCITNRAGSLGAEDVDHLFERFWRGDKARTSQAHSGLGLALARACAEAMGWGLEARLNAEDHRLQMRIVPKF